VSRSQGTNPGTCSGLLEPGTTPFTVTVKWKGTGGKINPSTIVFPSAGPEGGGFGLHDGDVGGSYAGTDNADAQANVDLGAVANDLATECDPQPPKNKPPKGIKKITIISGTLDIT
jgi:hypothetical protein